MTENNESIIALFILFTTSLAIGYGFGIKFQRLPFTAEIGFSANQRQFLRWCIRSALLVGILLPIFLLVQSWRQPSSWVLWGSYLLTIAVQLMSERVFSRWLVPSVVVPIGFLYTAFRLWQLLDGFARITWTHLTLVGFSVVLLFWAANLAMLTTMVIPTIFIGSSSILESRSSILESRSSVSGPGSITGNTLGEIG